MTTVEPTLERYGEPLLRKVAGRLIRPRNQWSADDLRVKLADALDDAVIIDRALRSLPDSCRKILKLIHASGQPKWRVRTLMEFNDLLGPTEGVSPVAELLEAGLLFPVLTLNGTVADLNNWLALGVDTPIEVYAPPTVPERCQSQALQVELTPFEGDIPAASIRESDGLELPLRMAVVWQLLRGGSIRLAQHGGLFKRDLDRLRSQPILSMKPADALVDLPDLGILALDFAELLGAVVKIDDEFVAGSIDALASDDVMNRILAGLARLDRWDAVEGSVPVPPERSAAMLILVAALAEQKPAHWFRISDLAAWLAQRVPAQSSFDAAGWCRQVFLGLLHQLRLVQAGQVDQEWLVRLSPTGRAVVNREPMPPSQTIEQTLLVQPNHEIILYRQGMTPALAAALTKFAEWKSLGLACTLTVTAESVYRGLECGLSALDIQRTLERHGTRSVPDTVAESLKAWSSKRERVQVFPSAIILEFKQPAELQKAVQMGIVDLALTDRLGLVAQEDRLEYQQLRLTGSRDYLAAEETCVEVGDDGLTMTVMEGKSDLLLDPELRRLAEPTSDVGRYRMTLESLHAAKASGWDSRQLADWFHRRVGTGPTPAAKLLFEGTDETTMIVPTLLIRFKDSAIADGLATWPETAALLGERLAPTLFSVPEANVAALTDTLAKLGLRVG